MPFLTDDPTSPSSDSSLRQSAMTHTNAGRTSPESTRPTSTPSPKPLSDQHVRPSNTTPSAQDGSTRTSNSESAAPNIPPPSYSESATSTAAPSNNSTSKPSDPHPSTSALDFDLAHLTLSKPRSNPNGKGHRRTGAVSETFHPKPTPVLQTPPPAEKVTKRTFVKGNIETLEERDEEEGGGDERSSLLKKRKV